MTHVTLTVVALSGAIESAARAVSPRPSSDTINRGLDILSATRGAVVRVPRALWRELTRQYLAEVNGRTVAFDSDERGLRLDLHGDRHTCECGNPIEPDGLWEVGCLWPDADHVECGQCARQFPIEYRYAREGEDVLGDGKRLAARL